MGLFDTVLRDACHEISGLIAMQHRQFYFVRWRTKAGLAAGVFLLAMPAWAATMAGPHGPDPLLDSGPTSPCAAGADYAAASDVAGQPVVPADVGARPVPVPEVIAVPLHRSMPAPSQNGAGPVDTGKQEIGRGDIGRRGSGRRNVSPPAERGAADSPYVSLDGRALEPLVNPRPCR
jgi:hypothetical protein